MPVKAERPQFDNSGFDLDHISKLSLVGNTYGEVISNSGRRLSYGASRDFYFIEDPNSTKKQILDAQVVGDGIEFSLYTRTNNPDGSSSVHPDFHASAFVKAALNHFKSYGVTINRITEQWDQGDNDYERVSAAMSEGVDVATAISRTWTGKLYSQLGFGNVDFSKINFKILAGGRRSISLEFRK